MSIIGSFVFPQSEYFFFHIQMTRCEAKFPSGATAIRATLTMIMVPSVVAHCSKYFQCGLDGQCPLGMSMSITNKPSLIHRLIDKYIKIFRIDIEYQTKVFQSELYFMSAMCATTHFRKVFALFRYVHLCRERRDGAMRRAHVRFVVQYPWRWIQMISNLV